MATFDLNSINAALNDSETAGGGVDFTGKFLKLDTASDAQPIVDAINACPNLHHLTLTGNTLGVEAAKAIAKALETHPELKICHWSDMFTGRMKTEIPPALSALGDGMIAAGARLHYLDLSDNAFGPLGVEGLAALLQSDVCYQLQELRLNNNGLGVAGGRLLARALAGQPRRLKVFIAGRDRLEDDGAKALANVFEMLDLSNNEMGREACIDIVDALTHTNNLPTKVVLTGNSLGDAVKKQQIRDILGDAAELSDDGDGSDNEYAADSGDETEEGSDEELSTASEQSSSSATEDEHNDTVISLNHTVVEELEMDVGRFLAKPTLLNLLRLGSDAADVIDAHLQSIKEPSALIKAYVEAILMVSGLCYSKTPRNIAVRLYPMLLQRVGQQHAQSWLLAYTMLQGLQLIQSENNNTIIKWHIPSCFSVLADVINSDYFPLPLRETLRFFIACKMANMADDVKHVVQKHPVLYS